MSATPACRPSGRTPECWASYIGQLMIRRRGGEGRRLALLLLPPPRILLALMNELLPLLVMRLRVAGTCTCTWHVAHGTPGSRVHVRPRGSGGPGGGFTWPPQRPLMPQGGDHCWGHRHARDSHYPPRRAAAWQRRRRRHCSHSLWPLPPPTSQRRHGHLLLAHWRRGEVTTPP